MSAPRPPATPSAQIAGAAALVRAGLAPAEAWARADPRVGPGASGATGSLAGHVAAAMRLAHATGAPLADVWECLAAAERDAERVAADRDAAMAGPLASARMLQWLPVAGVALAVALEPGALAVLATTALGWMLAGAATALAVVGRKWLAAMTARAAEAGSELPRVAATLALVEAAVAAGKDIPGACLATADAIGPDALPLAAAGRSLRAGYDWPRAWSDVGADAAAAATERALRAPWAAGASPDATLRAEREAATDAARAAAVRATGELEARAALPLALCLLPAFIVAGVIPLVLAVARTALADA